MNLTSIATRVVHVPSHFSRRANEYVNGSFEPRSGYRYSVFTPWGEQHFRTLENAKRYSSSAKRAPSFIEAGNRYAQS